MPNYLVDRTESPIMAVVEAGGLALNGGRSLQWDNARQMDNDLTHVFSQLGTVSALLVSVRDFDCLGDVAYAEVTEGEDGDFVVAES